MSLQREKGSWWCCCPALRASPSPPAVGKRQRLVWCLPSGKEVKFPKKKHPKNEDCFLHFNGKGIVVKCLNHPKKMGNHQQQLKPTKPFPSMNFRPFHCEHPVWRHWTLPHLCQTQGQDEHGVSFGPLEDKPKVGWHLLVASTFQAADILWLFWPSLWYQSYQKSKTMSTQHLVSHPKKKQQISTVKLLFHRCLLKNAITRHENLRVSSNFWLRWLQHYMSCSSGWWLWIKLLVPKDPKKAYHILSYIMNLIPRNSYRKCWENKHLNATLSMDANQRPPRVPHTHLAIIQDFSQKLLALARKMDLTKMEKPIKTAKIMFHCFKWA